MELTQAYLKSVLHYDPDTGALTWLTRLKGSTKKAGDIAGRKNNGYLDVPICGKRYKAHRVAVFYMTGEWPPHETDHINGDKVDNRWENLRCVSIAENQKNTKLRADSTTGVTGVCWRPNDKKWGAHIKVKKSIWLGLHDNLLDAVAARKSAEIKYGFHTNHGRG